MAKTETASPSREPVTLTDQLVTIPMVDSMVEMLELARSKPLVGVGVQLAGWSCSTVAHKVNLYFGDQVLAADQYAGTYVASFKEKFPIIQKPTSEVVDHVLGSASEIAKTSARTALRSLPGRTVLGGLDGIIAVSNFLLDHVQPATYKKRSGSPRKPTRFKEVTKNGKSGPLKSSERTKSTQTPNKKTDEKLIIDGILKKPTEPSGVKARAVDLYLMVVVSPVQMTVKSMVKLRSVLNGLEGKKSRPSKSTGMTPEKKIEIEARRKVSPRKRTSSTFIGRLKRTTRRFLGLGTKAISLTQADIRSYLYPEVVKGSEDAEKKRKYDDIQTDPDSEGSGEDSLEDFDIDEYQSDEDPDYEDPSDHSTDSMEYEAGDTESDISFEKEGFNSLQIRDQPRQKPSCVSNENIFPTTKSPIKKFAAKPDAKSSDSGSTLTNGTDKKSSSTNSQNGFHDPKASTPRDSSAKAQTGSSATTTTTSKSEPAKSSCAPASKTASEQKAGKDKNAPTKAGTA